MRTSILSRVWRRAHSLSTALGRRIRGGVAANRGRILTTGRRVAVLGAFAFVVLLLHRELYSVLSRQDRYAIDPGGALVQAQPDWADTTGAERSPGPVAEGPDSALDDGVVGRIAQELERNPWVRRVVSLERVYPAKLRARIEMREPHLAVRTPAGYVLVDRELVRLPGVYAEPPVAFGRPRIAGVPGPPPKAGERWRAKPLEAGLELGDFCSVHPTLAAIGVAEIDVSDRAGRVVLRTASGCAIHWGRSESAGDREDLANAKKIGNLRRVLSRYPRLDGLDSVRVYVDGAPTIVLRDEANARRR